MEQCQETGRSGSVANVTIRMSRDFKAGFPQSVKTSMTNLADMITIEMKKLAPFANPAQYPNGYSGIPGTLMQSIKRQGQGMDAKIVSSVPYALIRNEYNNLNPQTKHYIERSVDNIAKNKSSQWWRASSDLFL